VKKTGTVTMLEKYKSKILDVVFERLDRNDCIVFLFGSHATNETVGSSDIDSVHSRIKAAVNE